MSKTPIQIPSNIQDGADVSLSQLSREEKEALITEKMNKIRQQNEALSQRYQLIEADRKRAEEAGQAVQPSIDSQTLPAEGAPRPRGRGRGYLHQRDSDRRPTGRANISGNFRSAAHQDPDRESEEAVHFRDSNYESPDQETTRKTSPKYKQQEQDTPRRTTPKYRRKPGQTEERSPPTFDYEPIVEISDLDKRFGAKSSSAGGRTPSHHIHENSPRHAQPHSRLSQERDMKHMKNQRMQDSGEPAEPNVNGSSYQGRLKDSEGPPPDPSFNPLADRRRSDMNQRATNNTPRHPRNYGGSVELSRVKQNMKTMREKERERPAAAKPMMMAMTGRERRNHEEWKAERERYDQERIQRQRSEAGSWRRAWDAEKLSAELENSEQMSAPMDPTSPQSDDFKQSSFLYERRQNPNTNMGQWMQDLPMATGKVTARGRGRGRGRGRSVSNDEQTQRPGLVSHSEDRQVEHQKDNLVIKIDRKSLGDSVEVRYEGSVAGELDQTTVLGREHTRQAKNVSFKQQQNQNRKRQPKSKSGNSEITPPSHYEATQNIFSDKSNTGADICTNSRKPASNQTQPVPGTAPLSSHPPPVLPHTILVDQEETCPQTASRQPTTDTIPALPSAPTQKAEQQQHKTTNTKPDTAEIIPEKAAEKSPAGDPDPQEQVDLHSYEDEDSDQWEDCTEDEAETADSDQDQAGREPDNPPAADHEPDNPPAAGHEPDNPPTSGMLHLQVSAPAPVTDFLPTSPDFMKTPPGHVHVLNWAAEGCPLSPEVSPQVSPPKGFEVSKQPLPDLLPSDASLVSQSGC